MGDRDRKHWLARSSVTMMLRLLLLLGAMAAIASGANEVTGLSDPVASDDVVPERSLQKEPASLGAESESLMQTGAKARSSDDDEKPCMVIAGVRHGSRFPTSGHEWTNQAAWPRSRSRFWDFNSGALTVQGTDQMIDVGSKFGDMYPSLFEENRYMKIFTDSYQRTVQSAAAFLKGAMGGETPAIKISDQDDDGTNNDAHDDQIDYFRRWEVQNTGGDDTPPARDFAVQVHMVDSILKDPEETYSITNNQGNDMSLDDWQQYQYQQWCVNNTISDEEYLMRMSNATGYKADTCEDKVSSSHTLYNQMKINKAVGLKCIPNFVGEKALDDSEQESLTSLNSEVTPLWFNGNDGTVDESAARYAGSLGAVVAYSVERMQGHLQETDGTCNDPRFVMFSGHDSNLLQIFAILGLEPQSWPTFSSYWVIEVYQDKVMFCYNWDGESNPDDDPQCIRIVRQDADDERADQMMDPDDLEQDKAVNTAFFLNSLARYQKDQVLSDEELEAVRRTREVIFQVHENPFADDYNDANKYA